MDSSSQPSQQYEQQPSAVAAPAAAEALTARQYITRKDIRRAIQQIVRRLTLERLALRRLQHPNNNNNTRLTKADRRYILRQTHLLEEILYKRADTMTDFQDMNTLEERVYRAGRAVFINAQRREMERESERRVAMVARAAIEASRARRAEGVTTAMAAVNQSSRSWVIREGRPTRRLSF